MVERVKRHLNHQYQRGVRPVVFFLDLLGYGGHWTRRVMNQEIKAFIQRLPAEKLSVAEISGGHYAGLPWGCYTSLQYPAFDICADQVEEEDYDLIFCEQVLEHVWEPQKAIVNLWKMLRPAGLLVVSTPFLIKIHKCSEDFWRFTPDCLQRMLEQAGFTVEALHSWGNRACVAANLNGHGWARYRPYLSVQNERDVPVVIWAYARKQIQ